MKKSHLKRMFFLFMIVFLSTKFVLGSDEIIEKKFTLDEIPAVLNMLADKAYENYAKIETWEGKIYSSVDIFYYGTKAKNLFKEKGLGTGKAPEKIKKNRESVVEFVSDFESNSFYSSKYHFNAPKYINPDTGNVIGIEPFISHERLIVTNDYKITSYTTKKSDGTTKSHTAKKEKRAPEKECTSRKDRFFDPRNFLSGQPVWEQFAFVIQFIQEKGGYSIDGHSLKVKKYTKGNLTEYHIEIPGLISPGEYLFKTLVFSSKNNYNVSSVETNRTDGELFQKLTWDYKVIDGVYLPIKTTKQSYTGKDSELSYSRECNFSKMKLNHTIPKKNFTYESLGLKNGDIFIDQISNKKYKYQNGALVIK